MMAMTTNGHEVRCGSRSLLAAAATASNTERMVEKKEQQKQERVMCSRERWNLICWRGADSIPVRRLRTNIILFLASSSSSLSYLLLSISAFGHDI